MIEISTIIDTDIDFKINKDLLLKLLHTDESSSIASEALSIANDVKSIVKPKFILKRLNIDDVNNDSVMINSNKFKSKILAHHLKEESAAFVYIVTCGKDISDYADSTSDYLQNYILDQIAYMGYLTALQSMKKALEKDFNVKKYISFAPGSVLDWNVVEVKKIFKLFDEEYKKLGVNVLDSGLIDPLKSTSGILIESENDFHSCATCNKIKCPNRKREFDEEKYNDAINL